MKLLRQTIRKIILESVKETFNELWYNVEDERSKFEDPAYAVGSHHRNNLKQLYLDDAHPAIDELFEDKRDLKKLWNEQIDIYDLRNFWEGPKMKYFHSLSYYGSPTYGVDKLQTAQEDDKSLRDLTAHGFFQLYDKSGNKDEMSAYGIYKGKHQIPPHQQKFGVLISGRVTLATMEDAFTESRSKATNVDLTRHAPSGMPKRIMPSDDLIATLLFEEDDIIESGKIGECILDNWSIDAIVCNRNIQEELVVAAQILAKQYGVPLLNTKDLGTMIK